MPAPRAYPQRVEHGFQQLGGKPVDEFAPNLFVLFLALVSGVALFLAGSAFCVYAIRHFDEDTLEFLWLPLALLAIGGFLAWHAWSLHGQLLLVCPHGLILCSGHSVRICRWDTISCIEQQAGQQSYEVVLGKGERWRLDWMHTPRIGKLGKMLQAEARTRNIPWRVKQKAKEEEE